MPLAGLRRLEWTAISVPPTMPPLTSAFQIVLLIAGCFVLSSAAQAEKADRSKPMVIEAVTLALALAGARHFGKNG